MESVINLLISLFEIDAEMTQLENEIRERCRALNVLYRTIRAINPQGAEEHTLAARERIRERQGGLCELQTRQLGLIVQAVTYGDR